MADKELKSLILAGLPDRYVIPKAGTALTVTITAVDGVLTADKGYAELFAAHNAGQTVYCRMSDGSVLPLMMANATGLRFQSVTNQNYQWVAIKSNDTILCGSGNYALAENLRSLWYVFVAVQEDGSYDADKTMLDIRQAYGDRYPVVCTLEVGDVSISLPLVRCDDTAVFTGLYDGSTYTVTITADGVTVEQSEVGGGGSGNPGEDGGYYTPTVTDNGDGTMAVSFAASNADMPAVDPVTVVLPEGQDGYSVTANVTQTDGGAIIHIYDKDGHTFATVDNGKDGTDGVSPTVTTAAITGGHRITITDVNGAKSIDVMDGENYSLTDADKKEIAGLVGDTDLPDYWNAYLPDRISAILEHMDDVGTNGIAFLAVTDRHADLNAGYTAKLIHRIVNETGMLAADLGDVAKSGVHSDKAELIDTLDEVMGEYRGLKMLRAKGNHDTSYGTLDGVYYAYNISNNTALNRIYRQLPEGCVAGGDGMYYYYDDKKTKTRFIVMNTIDHPYEENADGTPVYNGQNFYSVQQAQIDFVISALSVDEGWHVFVMCHVPPVDAYADKFPACAYIRKLLSAYKDKTACAESYAGVYGGSKAYTNLADKGSEDWVDGKRINSSANLVDASGVSITNFIPVDDVVSTYHIKGLDILSAASSGDNYGRIYYYSADKMYLGQAQPSAKSEFFSVADYDESVCVADWSSIKAYWHTDKDYAYVRFGGIPSDDVIITADEEIVESETGWDALSINADFSGYKGDLVAMITGHTHKDHLYTSENQSNLSFPIITVACDGNVSNGEYYGSRETGTTTEHSFDVFIVNYDTGTISTVKIGAGEDRTISY